MDARAAEGVHIGAGRYRVGQPRGGDGQYGAAELLYAAARARRGELSAGVGGGARFRGRAIEGHCVRARDRRLSGAGVRGGQADGLSPPSQ